MCRPLHSMPIAFFKAPQRSFLRPGKETIYISSNIMTVLCYNPELTVKCLQNSVRSNVASYELCKH